MFGLTDVHRAVARRTLVCPYCNRLQAIPLQSAGFSVGCRKCHRVFRVTETGAVADVESARAADGAAPGRSPGDQVRSLLRGLRSVVIALLALAVIAEAIRQLGSLDAARSAGRRALLEGSMTAPAGDWSRVLARERDGRREAVARYDRRIAAAAGDPSLQALWRDLKRRDLEEVQLLERHLSKRLRVPGSGPNSSMSVSPSCLSVNGVFAVLKLRRVTFGTIAFAVTAFSGSLTADERADQDKKPPPPAPGGRWT